MSREPWYPSRVHPGAHGAAALALLLAGTATRAADPVRYRFEAGKGFSFQVVQETRPAQGPAFSRGELTYRFEVQEAAGGTARLKATIAGKGVRGPDPASATEQGRTGRTLEYKGLEVGLALTDRGPRADSPPKPAKDHPAASPEWAIVNNAGQFFPVLADQGAKVRGKVFGPDLFRDFPDDRPELTGLMWTEEAVETSFAAPAPVRVGGKDLVRVDFTGGFEKTTTHRGVDFAGTYTIVGFALIDPAVGRPVAFKIDDAKSQYQIRATGGSFIPRKVAERRLAAANNGRTPILLEACDPDYLEALREYAGFKKLARPAGQLTAPRISAELPMDQAPATSLLGM